MPRKPPSSMGDFAASLKAAEEALRPGPRRIRLSRAKGWRLPPNTHVVARPTKWGNPFVVGQDGTAAECVDLYHKLLSGRLCLICEASIEDQQRTNRHAAAHLGDLRGKNLACWCALDKPCHADVLLDLANAPESGQ